MRYITWKHTVYAIHETHKLNPPPLQCTTVPPSSPFSIHPHTHLINPTLNPNTVISPSHMHTQFEPPHSPSDYCFCMLFLYLMHAGPPQSGHGCPERQVCDLPTLVLWFSFGCQFWWRQRNVKIYFFLTNQIHYWYKSVTLTSRGCVFSLVPIFSWRSTHL